MMLMCIVCPVLKPKKSWTNKVLRLLKGFTICIQRRRRRRRHIQILIKVAPRLEYHLSFIIAKDAFTGEQELSQGYADRVAPATPFPLS